jgi:hypothetical protein
MYRQVGAGWHWALDWAELWHHCDGVNSNNPYCDPNYSGSNHVSLAESWAEFLGTNYAIRLYGDSSRKIATSFFELDPFNNIIVYNFNKTLIEKERWFFGGKWIPYGIFNDLMDEKNSDESWDLVEGATIKQMYDAFNPNIASICEYQNNFLQNNPIFNQQNVKDIFINHACNCK